MTQRETKIVNELRKNSRKSLTDISRNTETHLSTTFKIVKRLENTTIKKYTCLIDFTKLGYPFKIGLFLKADDKTELKKILENHPNLNTLFRLSGDYDYYAEFLFKDMAGFQDFLDELNSELVEKMGMHFITDVKQEEFKIGCGR